MLAAQGLRQAQHQPRRQLLLGIEPKETCPHSQAIESPDGPWKGSNAIAGGTANPRPKRIGRGAQHKGVLGAFVRRTRARRGRKAALVPTAKAAIAPLSNARGSIPAVVYSSSFEI